MTLPNRQNNYTVDTLKQLLLDYFINQLNQPSFPANCKIRQGSSLSSKTFYDKMKFLINLTYKN